LLNIYGICKNGEGGKYRRITNDFLLEAVLWSPIRIQIDPDLKLFALSGAESGFEIKDPNLVQNPELM
jgi:hypothetical protein